MSAVGRMPEIHRKPLPLAAAVPVHRARHAPRLKAPCCAESLSELAPLSWS